MKAIWAPWRMDYIVGEKPNDCIFCSQPEGKQDRAKGILYKGGRSSVTINKFPYTYGHLLISPNRHASKLEDLKANEITDLALVVQKSLVFLKKAFQPEGFNIGLNQGKVAGAGIEEHLHFHLVPRWFGDVNFILYLLRRKLFQNIWMKPMIDWRLSLRIWKCHTNYFEMKGGT